jgi:hypothetical protein
LLHISIPVFNIYSSIGTKTSRKICVVAQQDFEQDSFSLLIENEAQGDENVLKGLMLKMDKVLGDIVGYEEFKRSHIVEGNGLARVTQ